jgi:hypothetical protein
MGQAGPIAKFFEWLARSNPAAGILPVDSARDRRKATLAEPPPTETPPRDQTQAWCDAVPIFVRV